MSSIVHSLVSSIFFFFNDTATTEIYTLSLHDALPISPPASFPVASTGRIGPSTRVTSRWDSSNAGRARKNPSGLSRSEEHTSELQSPCNFACRLLLGTEKGTLYRSR